MSKVRTYKSVKEFAKTVEEEESKAHKDTKPIMRTDLAKSRKRPVKKAPPQGLPGATRLSTITGLMDSPTNRKWEAFLYEGPYWNYLVNFITRKNIFRGRRDRVEEAAQNGFRHRYRAASATPFHAP